MEKKKKRFKSLDDVKHYWKDATDAPHIDTLLFLVQEIEYMQERMIEIEKNVRYLEGWRD